jgi:3-deoxy-D-manno-octulosonic-acid transferase
MDELLTYPEVLDAVGKSAGEFVSGNAGATQQIMKEINL